MIMSHRNIHVYLTDEHVRPPPPSFGKFILTKWNRKAKKYIYHSLSLKQWLFPSFPVDIAGSVVNVFICKIVIIIHFKFLIRKRTKVNVDVANFPKDLDCQVRLVWMSGDQNKMKNIVDIENTFFYISISTLWLQSIYPFDRQMIVLYRTWNKPIAINLTTFPNIVIKHYVNYHQLLEWS